MRAPRGLSLPIAPSARNIGLIVLIAGVVTAAVAIVSVSVAFASSAASREEVTGRAQRAQDLRLLERAASSEYTNLVAVGALGDLSYFSAYLSGRAEVESLLGALSDVVAPDDPIRADLDEVRVGHETVGVEIDRLLTEAVNGDWSAAAADADIASLQIVATAFLGRIDSLIRGEYDALAEAQERDRANQHRLLLTLYGVAGLAASVTIIALALLFYYVVRPFRLVLAGTQSIAKGDHEERIPDFGDTEMGRIGRNVNALADALLKYADELNGYLEKNLEERTRDLERTNEKLRSEIQIRAKTEEQLQSALTAERALEQELEYQAFHDALTGLPNRAMFAQRLEHAVELANVASRSVTLLYLDLDDFKAINDTWGHGDGDHVLKEVARRVSNELGSTDTVARLGGDEFAILIEENTDEAYATDLATRVLASIHQRFTTSLTSIAPRCSVGIASATTDARADGTELLRRADVAMYFAKRQGKHRIETYAPSMETALADQLELMNDIEAGLERGEFFLEYQPVYDLSSGTLEGFEALIRWEHPTRGLLNPASFIPIAEESGLIVAMGDWVLAEAVGSLAQWRRRYPATELTVAVNVSARQFSGDGLVASVRSAVAAHGLPPGALILEITESAVMQDVEQTTRVLQELRALGVGIAIDDFGTGYASISYLSAFPFSTLKIDRSFVKELLTDRKEAELTRTIVRMAHAMDLAVVAEGIETEQQYAALREMNCQSGQGYLMARPLPARGIEDLLASASERAA